jgi:chromosome segregation protein
MDAAQRERQELEGQISKAEGESSQLRVMMNTLNDSLDQWLEEQEELSSRKEELDRQSVSARERLTALEGQAEAARAEAEGKAQGEQQFRERDQRLNEGLTEHRTALAALEAQSIAVEQALEELRRREADLAADRESREQEIQECRVRERELRGEMRENAGHKEELLRRREELSQSVERCSAGRMELERERVEADKAARDKNTELLNMERECSVLEQKRSGAEMEEKQIIEKLWEGYELTYDSAAPQRQQLESPTRAARQISDLKRQISSLGAVNVGAIEDHQRMRERYDYLIAQRDDVEKARQELEEIIQGITDEMKKIFEKEFQRINEAFSVTFQELFGGGVARLELEDPEDILNCGIEIRVQPPGKVLKVLSLLSGGEKAFVAIALYFAFLKVRPTPFVVMDEIEAALDDNNVTRFADYMRRMTNNTQFIAITHRRGTMEEADVLYGVTMQERGVSRMLMLNLNEAEAAIQG